ncbi:MAG: serine O-acetyltransferase [Gammaproteobacteria bacterium]
MAGDIWLTIREEAENISHSEPILSSFLHATILSHDHFDSALSFHLSNVLDSATLPAIAIQEVIAQALEDDPSISCAAQRDIIATRERDAVCNDFTTPLLYFKGFHALQGHRIAHHLWQHGRHTLALFFQSRISTVLAVDIHPAARIGAGILIDHATGIVIGETAVVDDDVSLLHAVTLGGTGKTSGDRHPKIHRGVLLSAGAKILGNVTIGECAKVAAGSVVLSDVPPHTTVAGVPAKIVGQTRDDSPALTMNHCLDVCNGSPEA